MSMAPAQEERSAANGRGAARKRCILQQSVCSRSTQINRNLWERSIRSTIDEIR